MLHLNFAPSAELLGSKLLAIMRDEWKDPFAQQVVLNRNLHNLELYNGATGIVVNAKNDGQKVVFRRGRSYQQHALDRLSGIESAVAITVHKSQGSEFDEVLLVLPEQQSQLLTRQIIYTGMTRARTRIQILGKRGILGMAIDTRDERPGGIVPA